ncbi:NTP transferase domain-containing protein [bacterium]|nr:NTP transferase domain-containing protein [bacterium]
MKAVIMAGGFGTRLRPLTFDVPKPMVPILNRPIMEYNVKLLKKHGITDIVSSLYYQPEIIKKYFKDGSQLGVDISYVMASEDLGTAGSVKNAIGNNQDRLIIISADVLTDFDLNSAIRYHERNDAFATIVLTRVENPLAFGIVIMDDNGKITRFLEKPGWGQVFSDTINTGIYILEPEVLDWIPEAEEYDFSKDLFPLLLSKRKPLYGFITEGYWRDIGNHKDYYLANKDALNGLVNLEFPGKKADYEGAQVWIDEGAVFDKEVDFKGKVILGRNVHVSGNAAIENSIIGDSTKISHSSRIERSIIWSDVEIGEKSEIYETIIASDVKVGSSAWVQENVVISSGCRIGVEAQINPNVRIWPDKIVSEKAILASSLVWGERWSTGLFSNSRVTGIINEEIPPEFASKLGASFGSFVGKGESIAISWDADRASQMTANAFISGLLSAGANVIRFGILPIPVVRFALNKKEGGKGGIHIRKSPNDYRLQDLIFFDDKGYDLPINDRKKIERLYFREDFPRAAFTAIGSLSSPSRIASSYIKEFNKKINKEYIKKGNFHIVVDYDFGGTADVLPSILANLDCRVTSLNAYVDTRQITTTRQEREKKIKQLSNIIKALSADVGFMIDPSGERLYILTGKGKLLDFHEELYFITKLVLETKGVKCIGVPISATIGINKLAREYGIKLIYTKNDHRSMMEAAMKKNIGFVGGTRGGYIFTEFSFACDAMYSIIKILELLGRFETAIEDTLENIPELYRAKKEIKCPWRSKGKVMRKLLDHTDSNFREVIDGVRLFYDDAWILLIPHPEKPYFVLESESSNKAKLNDLLDEFTSLIERWESEND